MSFSKETNFKVKTRAKLEGLFLAWDKGYRKIEVECDNALLIDLLLSGGRVHSSLVELRLLHCYGKSGRFVSDIFRGIKMRLLIT